MTDPVLIELVDELDTNGLAKEVCIKFGVNIIYKLKAQKVQSGDFAITIRDIQGTRVLNTAYTPEGASDTLYDESLKLFLDTIINYQRGKEGTGKPIRRKDFKVYVSAVRNNAMWSIGPLESAGRKILEKR